jgi:hypothetical protein
MISRLLQILEENQGELDLYSLSRQLGAQPSAVAGMFQILIQKGRVIEIGSDCGPCNTCNLNSHCPVPVRRSKRYQLSEPNILDSWPEDGSYTQPANSIESPEFSPEPEQASVVKTL